MQVFDLTMTVNRVAAPTATTFDVVNPATAQVFAQAPICDRVRLETAMDAARIAYGLKQDRHQYLPPSPTCPVSSSNFCSKSLDEVSRAGLESKRMASRGNS